MIAPLRILGIDPGSRATGYGVIDKKGNELHFVSCGVIRTSSKRSFPERLKEIHDGVSEVIAKHRPTHAAVEDIFRLVRDLNGTLSGEHGIGLTKAPYLGMEITPAAMDLQRRLKAAFDPHNLMNPGKIFPSPPEGSG